MVVHQYRVISLPMGIDVRLLTGGELVHEGEGLGIRHLEYGPPGLCRKVVRELSTLSCKIFQCD
jgi:hypothetical protein